MPKKYQFELPFDVDLEKFVKKTYPEIREFRTISKSLDARGAPRGKKPIFHYILDALVTADDKYPEAEQFPKLKQLKQKPIIIGAGPGGLFCAVRLAEYGIPSIVIERGDEASKRMLHIAKFWRYGELDPETNVCYGEGGAGLFSDGKLITRIKSNLVQYVMEKFVDFGAPADTAYVSNPHLGSNKIRTIITQISNWLRDQGTELRYNTRVDELLTEGNKVVGVKLSTGEKLYSDHVVLATGHSAQDLYQHLADIKVAMKPKDFAIGVRVEHPRRYIDSLQHGKFCEAPEMGSARYRLSWHDKWTDRGVYSFCMCPGGYVLSSGTEKDGIVVNGMSNYARNSPWSNAALVVSVKSERDLKSNDLMAGLKFQHEIEQKAFALSKKNATGRELPAMTIKEFMEGKLNDKPLPKTSSPSGIFKADIREIFPPFVIEHLKKGLAEFNKDLAGFVYEEGLLIAPETRTSAPLTILRDKKSLLSVSHQGLYPCGEGAGYAGGITSAAVDGVKCALSILEQEKLLDNSGH
ncbi:NAD(P)/FAD-dependent oxidoreductase [Peredibacter sp. HCB2-198]|uniref:NAD(P)/FAD-dependent oxidoreductase n=1 Tax=Peredibacter sp. HCB2-198 TaxID=3383025 RepID=UPI0038B4872C